MRVVLTELEVRIADLIARARYERNREAGVMDQRAASDGDIDKIGVCGELCVAKALNLYPDFTEHLRSGGFDLVTHKGKRLDVKTTTRKAGRLLKYAGTAHADTSDAYMLVVFDEAARAGKLCGWMWKGELLTDNRLDRDMPKPCYAASQSDLRRVGIGA